MNYSSQQGQELMNSLITKCWEDDAFKKSLINAPVETIEKLTGKTLNLPKGVRVVVNDQTNPSFVHLNIPSKVDVNDLELTEKELEAISGGFIVIGTALALVGAGISIGKCLN